MVSSRFNPDDFPGKIVMQVKSVEEYNILAKVLTKSGRRMYRDMPYTEFIPPQMPLYIYFNDYGYGVTIEFCKENCFIVLEMGDFEW